MGHLHWPEHITHHSFALVLDCLSPGVWNRDPALACLPVSIVSGTSSRSSASFRSISLVFRSVLDPPDLIPPMRFQPWPRPMNDLRCPSRLCAPLQPSVAWNHCPVGSPYRVPPHAGRSVAGRWWRDDYLEWGSALHCCRWPRAHAQRFQLPPLQQHVNVPWNQANWIMLCLNSQLLFRFWFTLLEILAYLWQCHVLYYIYMALIGLGCVTFLNLIWRDIAQLRLSGLQGLQYRYGSKPDPYWFLRKPQKSEKNWSVFGTKIKIWNLGKTLKTEWFFLVYRPVFLIYRSVLADFLFKIQILNEKGKSLGFTGLSLSFSGLSLGFSCFLFFFQIF
jgi:hypothetical protein